MKKCKLSICGASYEPTAQHQRFHSDLCRYKYHQLQRQRLIRIARKLQKKEATA